MIYFIQDTRSREIKIGLSDDPIQRLKQLQTAHASELKLIAVMDGSYSHEQALHQLFTRKRGEWFTPTTDLLSFIRENTVGISPIVNSSRGKSVFMSQWKPELQGDDFIVSMARATHYILAKDRGTIEEMSAMMYPGYVRLHAHDSVIYPEMSLTEFQGALQRLVDIQNE